jgi:hypothetical protein
VLVDGVGYGLVRAARGPSTSARSAPRAGLVGLDRRAVDERQGPRWLVDRKCPRCPRTASELGKRGG